MKTLECSHLVAKTINFLWFSIIHHSFIKLCWSTLFFEYIFQPPASPANACTRSHTDTQTYIFITDWYYSGKYFRNRIKLFCMCARVCLCLRVCARVCLIGHLYAIPIEFSSQKIRMIHHLKKSIFVYFFICPIAKNESIYLSKMPYKKNRDAGMKVTMETEWWLNKNKIVTTNAPIPLCMKFYNSRRFLSFIVLIRRE